MTPRSTGTSACDTGTQRECGRPSSLITVRRITRLSFLALRTKRFLCGFLLCTLAQALAVAQTKPEEVVFSSGGPELHGFLWKPEGTGPFPAIVWNHGSEKLPGSQPALTKFYTAHSYVFFVPHRRGQGRSPGNYIQDLVAQAPPGERARRMVELQQAAVVDVIAGLNYRRFRLFSGRRSQIETPAVEVNRVNEILFVPESPSCVFDPLDLRVERFARSIGDAMP